MALQLIPIISYHAIGDFESPLFLHPQAFEAQLSSLVKSGFRSISFSELINYLKNDAFLPDNAIILSFDDGYANFSKIAWPVLQAWGFGATVFLVTDYCGSNNHWPSQPTSVPKLPLLTWEQIEALANSGCEFGAHTRSHPVLPLLSIEKARDEISTCKLHIEAHIGEKVRVFAYPYGAMNEAVKKIVMDHYEGAVSTNFGLVNAHSDRYSLLRIDSYYLTPRLIELMTHPVFNLYINFRRSLRTIRRKIRPDWKA